MQMNPSLSMGSSTDRQSELGSCSPISPRCPGPNIVISSTTPVYPHILLYFPFDHELGPSVTQDMKSFPLPILSLATTVVLDVE
jgi:hypothetical protein